MTEMGDEVSTVDEDVVEVNDNANVEERMENVIDEALKCSGGVSQTEWHDGELVVTVSRAKGCLGDILFLDADLMIPGTQIELGENTSALDPVEDLVDTW